MFLANFIFVVSHLKIHPAIKCLLDFVLKKDKMVAECPDVQIEQARILI